MNPAHPPFSAADHAHMARALQLAERGLTTTTPNPRVGCVLVQGDVRVGEGAHLRAGDAHAEVIALEAAGPLARGATAYVTLEPCNHHGRTPPCVNALLNAGVRRVVAAMTDPNPQVAGAGLARLAAAGVVTQSGLMASAARELNLGFVSRMTRARPWVRVKIAASIDGQSAPASGPSQWITHPPARHDAHHWRARACALLTGSGTLLVDNPALTVRDVPSSRAPIKVIADSRLVTPPDARVFESATPVWVFHASDDAARIASLTQAGALCTPCADGSGHVDLTALLHHLAERGINELQVEAGARLNGALLAAGLVDELLLYLAPTLLGSAGRGLFDLPGLTRLDDRRDVTVHSVRMVGPDLRLLARFE